MLPFTDFPEEALPFLLLAGWKIEVKHDDAVACERR